eukprot:366450_1
MPETTIDVYPCETQQPTTTPTGAPTAVTAEPPATPTVTPTAAPTAQTVTPTLQPTIQPTLTDRYMYVRKSGCDFGYCASNATNYNDVCLHIDGKLYGNLSDSEKFCCVQTVAPTYIHTLKPTYNPTLKPTYIPTLEPVYIPTLEPTTSLTSIPSKTPSKTPTNPTLEPTFNPSLQPTLEPTLHPTIQPTFEPTLEPIFDPNATQFPTTTPILPTRAPTPYCPKLFINVSNAKGFDANDFNGFYTLNLEKIVFNRAVWEYFQNPNEKSIYHTMSSWIIHG